MLQTQTVRLGTRVGAAAVDLAISAGVGTLIAIAAGYKHQRYIEVGAEGTKLGSTTHQSFSFTVLLIATTAVWFGLAIIAARDAKNRTPGQRRAGYGPQRTGAGRLELPELLRRQAFRITAAPSALMALSQGRDEVPRHDAMMGSTVVPSSDKTR